MAEGGDAPVEVPEREIPIDVQRTREQMMIPAEWLVLFRGALPSVYKGVPHPTRLEMWIG